MKKIKGRGILVTLLLVFGAYAYYDHVRDQKKEKQKLEETRLLTLKYDHVNEIQIKKTGENILLKRTVDGWVLEEPVKDQADNQAVEAYINQFVTDKIEDVAKEGQDLDEAGYGLDQPLAIITLKSTDGQSDEFKISAKKNFEDNPFFRRNQESRILVGNSAFARSAEKTVNDFRDRRFLRKKIASVHTVQVKNKSGTVHIQQKDEKWVLIPGDVALDQNRVREFLKTIADAQASHILEVKDIPAGQEILKMDLGLSEGTWQATVTQASDKLIYAKVSEPHFGMRMAPGALDKFLAMTAKDLQTPAEEKKEEKT